MLKLNLQIQWIRLSYHTAPTKNHWVNFQLQNQQAEQLIFERKTVSPDQNLYFLDNLSPFQFHMVVGQNKPILCPFQLSLVSKLTPPIARIVPLKHADIFQHYLNHQLFAQIESLQQSFAFQEGQLVYKINFGESQTLKDVTEVEDLHKRLKKTESMMSEIKIKVSELTQQPVSAQESKLTVVDQKEGLSLTQPVAQMIKIEVKPAKRLRSAHSMSEMTISQIAKSLETQQQKRQHQVQKESEMYQTKIWYLKLDKQEEHHDTHDEHSGWSFKVKMLVALLVLGFFMLSFIILTGDADQQNAPIKLRKKIKVPKKPVEHHVEHR